MDMRVLLHWDLSAKSVGDLGWGKRKERSRKREDDSQKGAGVKEESEKISVVSLPSSRSCFLAYCP